MADTANNNNSNTNNVVNPAAVYLGYTGQDPRIIAAMAGYLNGAPKKTN